MYLTALLILLVFISLIWARRKNYVGLRNFNKENTLPLRGLLALLIVAHHLGQRTPDLLPSKFTIGIGSFIVAVFFLMSGYGLCVSYRAKRETYVKGFLSKRLGKLLPVFLVLTIGMVLWSYFQDHIGFMDQLKDLIFSGLTPLPHSWFIFAIFYVYVAFYLCALTGKSPKTVGLLFVVTTTIYIIVLSKLPHYWWITIPSVNVGYFLALYERSITFDLCKRRVLSYSVVLTGLFILECMVNKFYGTRSGTLSEIVLRIVQALSVYIVMRTFGIVKWKWLCAAGVFSLELYLIHGIPLKIGQGIDLSGYTLWLFTYALSVPCALMINKLFDIHLSKDDRKIPQRRI